MTSRGTTTTSFRIAPPRRNRYHRAVATLGEDLTLTRVILDYLDQLAEEQLGPADEDQQYVADLAAEQERKARQKAGAT